MRRPPEFENTTWQQPFWQLVRMCLDTLRAKAFSTKLDEDAILQALEKKNTSATRAFGAYLDKHRGDLHKVGAYISKRGEVVEQMSNFLRTETAARRDLRGLVPRRGVARYTTRTAGHHQSPKVLVGTVGVLTEKALQDSGVAAELNPQTRAAVFAGKHMWVSPRRLDGAIPALQDPVGIWEIKEYWGKTKGGSKMSDAIYECQLVGAELRLFEQRAKTRVAHYLVLDGKKQWASRRSDLGRAYDLLCSGLVDELIVGREVLEEWPRIAAELAKRTAS